MRVSSANILAGTFMHGLYVFGISQTYLSSFLKGGTILRT